MCCWALFCVCGIWWWRLGVLRSSWPASCGVLVHVPRVFSPLCALPMTRVSWVFLCLPLAPRAGVVISHPHYQIGVMTNSCHSCSLSLSQIHSHTTARQYVCCVFYGFYVLFGFWVCFIIDAAETWAFLLQNEFWASFFYIFSQFSEFFLLFLPFIHMDHMQYDLWFENLYQRNCSPFHHMMKVHVLAVLSLMWCSLTVGWF